MCEIEQSLIEHTSDPDCKECRKRICYRCNMIPESVAEILFSSDEYPYNFDDEAGVIAVKHLRECSECQSWFRGIIPEEIIERNEHASHYCCIFMYCAVEEHDMHSHLPSFHFGAFRDEETWWVDGKLACFRFCPWCATPLPNKPYREPAQPE